MTTPRFGTAVVTPMEVMTAVVAATVAGAVVSSSPVPSDDSAPNFKSRCVLPSPVTRPQTRATKIDSQLPLTQTLIGCAQEDPETELSSDSSTSSQDDDSFTSTDTLTRHRPHSVIGILTTTPPRMPWSWRTAQLDVHTSVRMPPLSRATSAPTLGRPYILVPRARRQPLRSTTPPVSPTSQATRHRQWLQAIQLRCAIDPFTQPQVRVVPVDDIPEDARRHLVRSDEHSSLTARLRQPTESRHRSNRPTRSCVNSPVREPSHDDSSEPPSSHDDNVTSGYDSPNVRSRLKRQQ